MITRTDVDRDARVHAEEHARRAQERAEWRDEMMREAMVAQSGGAMSAAPPKGPPTEWDIRLANGKQGDLLTILRGQRVMLADIMNRQPPYGGQGHEERLYMHQQRQRRLDELDAEITRVESLDGDALVKEFPARWT